MYDKQKLIALVREKALKFGDFTLASGKKAKYYLDGKQVTLDSFGAHLIAEGILEMLTTEFKWPDAVGGLAIGADPITAAVITVAGVQKKQLLGTLIRKEAKGHGTQKFIEGPVQPGQSIVIVEDVVTTGGSSLIAIEHCQKFGLNVAGVITVIDRLEGGEAAFAAKGIQLKSLLTIRDFGIEPPVN